MNLVIVEDSEIVRTQLIRIIEQTPRLNLLGVATEEEEAVRLILSRHPDAILLDLALAPGSGVRVLERIRKEGVGARVFVLTNNPSLGLEKICRLQGISGFFDKTRDIEECLETLIDLLPPLPDEESRRLEQLQSLQLLDTQEQETFDNLTQLAAEIVGVQISLISLVDAERQWFLSHTGLAARETPPHAPAHFALMPYCKTK